MTDGTVFLLAQAGEWLTNHSNLLPAAQLFKDCCKYYAQAWLVQMPPTLQCLEAGCVLLHFQRDAVVPWWHTAGLAVLGARDLPLLCYGTRPLLLLHPMTSALGFTPCGRMNVERCEVFCAHSWWTLWCYCSYVWSGAMCTFLCKWLFVLKMQLFYLLLSQEETQATPGWHQANLSLLSGPAKGWAVSKKNFAQTQTHTEAHIASPCQWVVTAHAGVRRHSPQLAQRWALDNSAAPTQQSHLPSASTMISKSTTMLAPISVTGGAGVITRWWHKLLVRSAHDEIKVCPSGSFRYGYICLYNSIEQRINQHCLSRQLWLLTVSS